MTTRVVAPLILGALLAAGCSSEDAPTAPTTKPDVELSEIRPPETGSEPALTFLGSGPTTPEGAPFVIGVINQSHGEGAAPNVIAAARTAMKVINEELGGIAGRPLRLEFCETTTGESERACAETLVAKNVDMVLTGLTPVDPGAMTTSLGELPVTGIDPRSVEEERNNNAAYYVLGRRGVLETAVTWVARNTEGAVLFVTDGESGEAELLEDASKRLRDAGRRSTTARLEPAGEGTTGKALENALENSGATVLVVNTGAAGCITVAETLRARSEEVRVITHGSCSQRQVHDTLGDWSRNWVHIAGGPDLSKYDEDLEAGYYRARFEADHPDGDWTAWASLTFSAIMNTTKAINLAVDTSGPGIVRALRELSGEGYASQGPLRCDRVPQRPALCLHTARLYTYDGKRAWQPAETDPLIDIHP